VEITDTEGLTKRSFRYVNIKLWDAASNDALSQMSGVEVLTRKPDGYVRLRARCSPDHLVKALAALRVEDLEIERPSLDEIFLAYYEANAGSSTDRQEAAAAQQAVAAADQETSA
jgi:ABC-2 type transport system ATP-binding protein